MNPSGSSNLDNLTKRYSWAKLFLVWQKKTELRYSLTLELNSGPNSSRSLDCWGEMSLLDGGIYLGWKRIILLPTWLYFKLKSWLFSWSCQIIYIFFPKEEYLPKNRSENTFIPDEQFLVLFPLKYKMFLQYATGYFLDLYIHSASCEGL